MRINSNLVLLFPLLLWLPGWPPPAWGADATSTTTRNVDGIADNSFLVEEAYNQEPGVVQHILTAFYAYDSFGESTRNWNLAFTQEWPLFSRTHQLSYSVPYNFTETDSAPVDGIGDVLLNYRYQVCYDEQTLTAFAPRLSLILPTGDDFRGGGEETLGYQANLPFSTTLNDRWFVHLNAGATFLPEAASSDGRDLWHYNAGASVIYAPLPALNFMLEWVGVWQESPRSGGSLGYEFNTLISPGFRQAFNSRNGAQLVLGAAAPIGLNRASPDYGVFLYVSFEHFFRSPP
jgi:hypothetical protein